MEKHPRIIPFQRGIQKDRKQHQRVPITTVLAYEVVVR